MTPDGTVDEVASDSSVDRFETDPARDRRADYTYTGGPVERPDLEAVLSETVEGEVRFDEYSRALYATDASAYEVTPVGVVFPTSRADVVAVMEICADREIPVLPRGGGTSLAGQTVNEAVVLDFTRHMDAIVDVDADARVATAQPGVRLGDLDAALESDGLHFPPDPAWGDKSALGGAVGNNSTGSHSLVYGKTDAYIEELEVVLADGTIHRFGAVTISEWREWAELDTTVGRIYATLLEIVTQHAGAIRKAYPDLERNVSGYNLDRLLEEYDDFRRGDRETVNLARVLAGSEGTLGIVTEVTVSLEPLPETKAVSLLAYDGLDAALADVEPILEFDPAAVEVLDDVLLDLARETTEFGDLVRETLPNDADSVLLVEFYATDDADGRRQVSELLADRSPTTETVSEPGTGAVETDAPVRVLYAAEAHDEDERARFWKLRKSGLPILLSRTTDEKHISFIEDAAVPPERLPEFVADFRQLLDEQGTFASFYGHAGPGCLHVRPLVNTKTVAGTAQMRAIADGATDLVLEYGGSVSGEHGDGRARTEWNRKLYGDRVFDLFGQLKTAFDPDGLLNPGQICGNLSMTDDLRYDPDYVFAAGFDPVLEWGDDGFQGMAELCHGCGGCRGPQETTGGVMCPTYRATNEESTSTRGRANALRAAMSGRLDTEATDPEFLREILDLCIGCKGCASDCPSEVDMAKLKLEVEHAAHEKHGAGIRDRLFANIETLSRWGSRLAPVSNVAQQVPGARRLAEVTLGIARDRTLPTFEEESFREWFDDRRSPIDPEDADRRVVLLPDPFSTYIEPHVARAAVRVLEAAGVAVTLLDVDSSGRAAYSKGFLDLAATRARAVVDELDPLVNEGWDVVAVEPSEAVMLQTEYLDVLGDEAETVASATYGVCEYVDRFDLDANLAVEGSGSVVYHGHCHQKATRRDHHAVAVLRRAGYEVTALDSTCCGMAGSFGYEAEHYSMSQAIGRLLFQQVDAAAGEPVAPGASCRTQLGDRDGSKRPDHPIERLSAAIVE